MPLHEVSRDERRSVDRRRRGRKRRRRPQLAIITASWRDISMVPHCESMLCAAEGAAVERCKPVSPGVVGLFMVRCQ
jgi:hypothetical protein